MIWFALVYAIGGAWLGLNSLLELPARRVTLADSVTIALVGAGWPLILGMLGACALFRGIAGPARANSIGIGVTDERNRRF